MQQNLYREDGKSRFKESLYSAEFLFGILGGASNGLALIPALDEPGFQSALCILAEVLEADRTVEPTRAHRLMLHLINIPCMPLLRADCVALNHGDKSITTLNESWK